MHFIMIYALYKDEEKKNGIRAFRTMFNIQHFIHLPVIITYFAYKVVFRIKFKQ